MRLSILAAFLLVLLCNVSNACLLLQEGNYMALLRGAAQQVQQQRQQEAMQP